MSLYTTGELAKLCSVTVRTVQYYDTRGILIPSQFSEGGRRLYSEEDLQRLKLICFLRELDLPIDSIGQLLNEPDPGSVIGLLIAQQEQVLTEELQLRKVRLEKLAGLKQALKAAPCSTPESIGDIAVIMENKKKLKAVHRNMLLAGIPQFLLELAVLYMAVFKGLWWLLAVYALLCIPFGWLLTRYYFRNVAYLCPQCHRVFRPNLKEAFFARHTPNTRSLTCRCCGHKGFCVEVYGGKENEA